MTTMTEAAADTAAAEAARQAAVNAARARLAAHDAATSAARAANGEGFRDALAEQAASRTLFDRAKAAPGALRGWILATLKTFKLDKAAGAVADAGRWAWSRLQPVLNLAKSFGLTNFVGAILTTPLRRQAQSGLALIGQVVTAPVRWIWRPLRWVLSLTPPTRALANGIENACTSVRDFLDDKIENAVQWLEGNEQHGAMRWLRWYFQANLARHVVRFFLPGFPGWVIYAVSLFVPTYGDTEKKSEKPQDRAQSRLDTVERAAHAATAGFEAAAEHLQHERKVDLDPRRSSRKAGDPYMRMEIAMLTDTSEKPQLGASPAEVVSFVDEKGVRRFRLGEQLLLQDDLPDTMAFVGTREGGLPLLQDQEGSVLEQQVRTAQATQGGRPPKLPRAARRAQPRARATADSTG